MPQVEVEVVVTPQDVIYGEEKSAILCPVALAVTKAISELGSYHVSVTTSGIVIYPSGPEELGDSSYTIPSASVRRFIRDFDDGEPIGELPRFFVMLPK